MKGSLVAAAAPVGLVTPAAPGSVVVVGRLVAAATPATLVAVLVTVLALGLPGDPFLAIVDVGADAGADGTAHGGSAQDLARGAMAPGDLGDRAGDGADG